MFYDQTKRLNENTDEIIQGLAMVDISEAHTPDFAGAMELIAESEASYNKIMKGIAISELSYFAENGTEMPVNEGAISDFFEKAANFFKKLWLKVKQIFAKFIATLDQWVKTNKGFYEKYSKMSLPSKFKFSGFNYTHLDWTPSGIITFNDEYGKVDVTADPSSIDDAIASLSNPIRADKIRKNALNASSDIKSSKFPDEVYKYFRNGKSVKTSINFDIQEALDCIKDYNDEKKKIKDDYKEFEDSFKDLINSLKDQENDMNALSEGDTGYENRSKLMTLASKWVSEAKTKQNISITVNGALLKALKERKNQAKAIVSKAARKEYDNDYKEKKAQYEGANYGGGYLANVNLI